MNNRPPKLARLVGMTLDELRDALDLAVLQAGSQKAVALKWGISEQYLCDVLKGRREPGEKFLKAMGLRKTVTYERE